METPPLLPPDSPAPPPLVPDSEVIRKSYLNHEASLQAVGSLYFLGGIALAVAGVAGMLGSNLLDSANSGSAGFASFLFLVLAAVQGWTGWNLRKLDPRAKIPATLLAVVGLFAFPIGTLINIYVLYLLHSAKGKYVLSPEYRDVIEATPHIRYKMSLLVRILIWLVIAILLLAVGVTLFGNP